MPIYDRSVRLLMREMIGALNLQPGQVVTRHQVLTWFHENYPKIKEGTIAAHLIRCSTNAPSRVHYRGGSGEDDLFFQVDGSHFRLYDPAHDPAPIYEANKSVEPLSSSVRENIADSEDPPREFAYERDLQHFLARNLSLLEPGLRLYEEEGITGLEFPVGGRFIDILALDRQNNYVVIELKVSKGYDRVVGQLLRYMAWIRQHHAEPSQQVRGIIVARAISEDLLLACSGLPGVALFEYELAVKLRSVMG